MRRQGSMGGDGIRESDAREMLRFVSELGGLESPDEFGREVLPGVRALVPSDIAAYNEVEFSSERLVAVTDPEDAIPPGGEEAFVRLGQQNVLIQRYQRTRDGRPYKWSDVISRRELHRTELYRELYGPLGIEYQMAFALPAPETLVIGVALNRQRSDFSERDRRVLNLLRGPLIQAYRTVERYAELAERLRAVERGLDRSGTGVVVLEPGRPAAAFASGEAARVLGLPERSPEGPLPERLSVWVQEVRADAGRTTAQAAPLALDAEGGTTLVHFLPARTAEDSDSLLVERSPEMLTGEGLRAAGLTARQAEVLRLVALGRSNAEIAAELTVSPRTVQKHLENVYERLGASSRTQAVLTAWSISRGAA